LASPRSEWAPAVADYVIGPSIKACRQETLRHPGLAREIQLGTDFSITQEYLSQNNRQSPFCLPTSL